MKVATKLRATIESEKRSKFPKVAVEHALHDAVTHFSVTKQDVDGKDKDVKAIPVFPAHLMASGTNAEDYSVSSSSLPTATSYAYGSSPQPSSSSGAPSVIGTVHGGPATKAECQSEASTLANP